MEVVNYHPVNFTKLKDIANCEQYLVEARKMLKGFKWWLAFGTALGFYRDGDFMPEDTDIDISVLTNDPQSIIDYYSKKYKYLRSVMADGRQVQSAFLSDDGMIIDFSFFRPEGRKFVAEHEFGKWEDKKFEIKNRKTPFGLFPFPNPIEDYLVSRYGNWQETNEDKSISV